MPWVEHRHRVLLEDTNLVGNVYFARYLDWQAGCRERLLEGQTVAETLLTTHCACEYLAEAAAGDEVVVRMRTARLARTLVTLEFEHWRGRTLLARGVQRLACVRRDGGRLAPAALSPSLHRAFEGARA